MTDYYINEVYIAKSAWDAALNEPFDAEKLQRIQYEYEAALRADRNYHRLCEMQRAIYVEELAVRRKQLQSELELLSKSEVATRCGYTDGAPKGLTKKDMIGMRVFSLASDGLENEYQRVRRIWAAMTLEEKTKP